MLAFDWEEDEPGVVRNYFLGFGLNKGDTTIDNVIGALYGEKKSELSIPIPSRALSRRLFDIRFISNGVNYNVDESSDRRGARRLQAWRMVSGEWGSDIFV